jgi:hypothetical protein
MLIPLGFHCNVTYLNQFLRIKTETGLFEWFESGKLQYITDLINTKLDDPNANVICGYDKYVYLLNPKFFFMSL